jgi:hypothetical protein
MSKLKVQMEQSLGGGKTSSERESKIFSESIGNEGSPQAIFAVKRTLELSKKDF